MSGPAVRTVNGITYPRDVECPPGFPTGWKGVEQAYSEASNLYGKTYVRWHRIDGKHKSIQNPKKVIELHCNDSKLDFDTEYAKFEQIKKEQEEAREREREAEGKVKGPKRDKFIALSHRHFGELDGPTVFALPGWKCRWDLIDSGQTPKLYTDPDGRQYRLVNEVECRFGAMIFHAGGNVPDELAAAVKAAKLNSDAHALFSRGSVKCREAEGSVELSAFDSEVKIETAAQRLERISTGRVRKSGKTKIILRMVYAGHDDYKAWDAKVNVLDEGDVTEAKEVAAIRNLLKARCVNMQKKSPDWILRVDSTGQENNKYAEVLQGFFFLKGKDDSDRPLYQGVRVSRADSKTLVGLDRYIYWSEGNGRWEMGTMRQGKAALAFSTSASASTVSVESWMILRSDFGSVDNGSSAQAGPKETPKPEPAMPATTEKTPAAEVQVAPKDRKDKKRKKASKDEHAVAKDISETAAKVLKTSSKASRDEHAVAKDISETAAKVPKTSSGSGSVDAPKEKPDGACHTDGRMVDASWHTSKIWVYEECRKRCGEDLTSKPAHWPSDCTICPGKWAEWLPPDWGQCKKAEPGGMKTKYVSPEGKVCHARSNVEKTLGQKLASDSDQAPNWPSWLPHDWGISTKSQGNSITKIYVQPERTRFLWCKADVDDCVSQGKVNQKGGVLYLKESTGSEHASTR